MEIAQIRLLNLRGLTPNRGDIKAVADRMPPDKNYANVLSQYRSGAGNIGNKFARLLEEALGKPRGWMDTLQFNPDDLMEGVEAMQISQALPPEDRESWLKHGRLLLGNKPGASASSPFPGVPKGEVKILPGPRVRKKPKRKDPRKS